MIIIAMNNYTGWIAVRLFTKQPDTSCAWLFFSLGKTPYILYTLLVWYPSHFLYFPVVRSWFVCFGDLLSHSKKRKEVAKKFIVKTQKGCTFPDPHTRYPLGSTFA